MTDTPVAINRTGKLKVIGAGFGRTGTLSLKVALEELGFGPCYHMTEVFSHPEHIDLWEAATRGEPVDWYKLFEEYQATVDWPGCTFYEDLMAAYPNAKVLLTVRDPERWYESARSTIYQVSQQAPHSPIDHAFFFMARAFVPTLRRLRQMVDALIWEKTFGGKFEDKEHAIAIFNQHIEEVKKRVPPEKLLVYNVKEGWEPLCTFLGVEVPKDKPFPHLNDRSSFPGTNMVRRIRKQILYVGTAALFAASFLITFLLLRRRRF